MSPFLLTAIINSGGVELDEAAPKQVTVAVSSDRGLCGGIHSGIAKFIKNDERHNNPDLDTKIVVTGDKARGILNRMYGKDILISCSGTGKKPPVFAEASLVIQKLLETEYNFTAGRIVYNHFRNAASYECTARPFFGYDALIDNEKLNDYEGGCEESALRPYTEFNMANNVYYAMLENAASEQSARMSAMDNATSNAGEMIEKLRMKFNRTRQAVITTELIEIISGASAMAD